MSCIFLHLLKNEFPNINFNPIKFGSNHMDTDLKIYNFVNLFVYNYNKFINFRILLDDNFIEIEKKEILLNAFCSAQKKYKAFCRVAYLYKLKHAIIYNNDCDFLLNSLSSLKNNIKISLYEQKTIYTFRISDLINIINTSLSNSPNFFSEPLAIKNPMTNAPFSFSSLYFIYFSIKSSTFNMPILFNLFFLCNFDLDKFLDNNECYLREIAIKNFRQNLETIHMKSYILEMISEYSFALRSQIHYDFPTESLINGFEHLMQSYLTAMFSLNPINRYIHNKKLKNYFKAFRELNKDYGKKIITTHTRLITTNMFKPNYKYFIDDNNVVYYFVDDIVDVKYYKKRIVNSNLKINRNIDIADATLSNAARLAREQTNEIINSSIIDNLIDVNNNDGITHDNSISNIEPFELTFIEPNENLESDLNSDSSTISSHEEL